MSLVSSRSSKIVFWVACPCLLHYQGIHVARITSVPSFFFCVGVQHIHSSWLASWFWCHPGVKKPILRWLVHAYLTIRAFMWPEKHQFLCWVFLLESNILFFLTSIMVLVSSRSWKTNFWVACPCLPDYQGFRVARTCLLYTSPSPRD